LIKMDTILGLIPARGGSKGIPGKNIYPLAGKPLLAYTCEAAHQSKQLQRVILSTDSQEIADVGARYGVDVPFLRPEQYAQDNTPSIDVVLHTLEWLKKNENWMPDIVVLLQPTSPLRGAVHIDQALLMFHDQQAETVVSVVKVPHRFSPYTIQKLHDGLLRDFWEQDVSFDRFRRQDIPELYARNGPAVLITRTDVLQHSKSFYGSRIIPYIMEEKYSIDIDDMSDLHLAEFMLTAGENRR
jgi:CMP-N,N'-diacetyllegionaminic acid synthase